MRDRYCTPCSGCKDGHPSFWKTIIESPQWKEWQKEQTRRFRNLEQVGNKMVGETCYDMAEVEELGCISPAHFADFLKFTIKSAT